jgi:hypothetical protein
MQARALTLAKDSERILQLPKKSRFHSRVASSISSREERITTETRSKQERLKEIRSERQGHSLVHFQLNEAVSHLQTNDFELLALLPSSAPISS